MKTEVIKSDEEILSPSQRWAGLAIVVAMLVLFGFFALHQLTKTGFFTTQFGSIEALALYGPIVISFFAPIVRAITGRQNPARPFEAATNLSLAIGSLWLALVFPLNFVHLADVVPEAIRFIFAWITNDIGRLILILQVIIGVVTAPLTMLKFFSVRRQASAA